jgi:SulP family sulfate permease
MPRITKRVPAPLVALTVVTLGAVLLGRLIPDFHVTTVGDRFTSNMGGELVRGIPRLPPLPQAPWGETTLTLGLIREMLPAAFAIAMLGAIESLLSAVVAD